MLSFKMLTYTHTQLLCPAVNREQLRSPIPSEGFLPGGPDAPNVNTEDYNSRK